MELIIPENLSSDVNDTDIIIENINCIIDKIYNMENLNTKEKQLLNDRNEELNDRIKSLQIINEELKTNFKNIIDETNKVKKRLNKKINEKDKIINLKYSNIEKIGQTNIKLNDRIKSLQIINEELKTNFKNIMDENNKEKQLLNDGIKSLQIINEELKTNLKNIKYSENTKEDIKLHIKKMKYLAKFFLLITIFIYFL